MEVMIPSSVQRMDLEFNNATRSSFLSPPSSPTGFGDCVFSAPTSPTRISEFYREFNSFSGMSHRQSSRRTNSVSVPFDWEERPGTPKSPKSGETRGEAEEGEDGGFDFDFAFDVSQELDTASLSAEELFDGGKIRPLKPPPRLQIEEHSSPKSPHLSPRSPRSPVSQGKKIIREAFSPRRKNERDPFEAAIENVRNKTEQKRGRDMSKNPSRRAARSLSPFRVSAYPWEEEEKQFQVQEATKQSSTASPANSSSSKSSSKKWRLRDFLLFRSSSESRAADRRDPMMKHSGLFRRPDEVKKESFQLNERAGHRRKVSTHEMIYATNKAASEDMKKMTSLPYKQGILGRLAFNPTAYGFTRP